MSINLKKILIYFLLLSAILFFPSKTIFGLLSSVEYALLAIVALLLFNRKSIKFEMPDNRILLFAAAIFFASLSFLINNSLFNDLSYIIRQVEYQYRMRYMNTMTCNVKLRILDTQRTLVLP